jgi:hypothetical protein
MFKTDGNGKAKWKVHISLGLRKKGNIPLAQIIGALFRCPAGYPVTERKTQIPLAL